MQPTYPPLPPAGPRPSATPWQAQLRSCIRHYVALGGPAIDAQELETHLHRTEAELLAYLLHGHAPTARALAQAQALLDLA